MSKNFSTIITLWVYCFQISANQYFICNPVKLVSAQRFDVMAKYIYAKHYKWNAELEWPLELYAAHLKVWGNFTEHLPLPTFPHYHCAKEYTAKNNLSDFIRTFNALIKDISLHGFDANKSVLPIRENYSLIDGSHRLGSALAYNIPITCAIIDCPGHEDYSADFFRNKKDICSTGLLDEYLDAMALEYCKLKENTFLISLFPCTNYDKIEVKKILQKYGFIVYEKEMYLYNRGPSNYAYLSYENKNWLVTQNTEIPLIHSQAKGWFPEGKGTVNVILYECENLSVMQTVKNEIRELWHTRYVIHTTDNHLETIKIAQTVFLKSGIHWLNKAHLKPYQKFDKYIVEFKEWLTKNKLDSELFCLDSGATLAAYGLRDCNDLDFLSKYDIDTTDNFLINNHKEELKYHKFSQDEIIFDPRNHFYYDGIKFAAPHVIKAMKTTRHEEKDKLDIQLIDTIIN